MSFSILIAEPRAVDNVYPFSLLHCSWEVRCGALRLFEKIQSRFLDSPLSFSGRGGHIRSFLSRFSIENIYPSGNILILQGGLLLTNNLAKFIEKSIQNHQEQAIVFSTNTTDIGYYIPADVRRTNEQEFQPDSPFFEDYNRHPALEHALNREVEAHTIMYLWDAISHNGNALIDDADLFAELEPVRSSPQFGVYVENPDSVFAGENCSIAPSVVLDASEGAIILGNNVRIMPQSTIMGPCFIGNNSLVKIGAKIYGNTSIGEHCKVGGEVDTSIIHAYSSKQHDGFIGHSYIGEWVNLGADCNTSNLKNTYGTVSVLLNGQVVNTGQMFLGLLCGDHSKSGINTMFTTGTLAGIFANIFGGGFFPQAISSFSWGGQATAPKYQFEKAAAVAELVMSRRNYTPTPEEKDLWKTVFGAI
jgi:UDP-N-acetylglucosamine diphosphorylase/glucosamine-1-phosphate N-acetyltransferase